MDKKRTYYRRTTGQQRRLLFEVWEETGDREEACRRARVGMGTFYYWRPRFEEGGYAGLETERSTAPKVPHQTPPEIVAQVVAMRQAHPEWGKRRIADELAKGNNWVPVVSLNTVRRILQDAGLWPVAEGGTKKGGPLPSAVRKSPGRR